MDILGKIRRMYFRDKLSLHEIAKRTGLARGYGATLPSLRYVVTLLCLLATTMHTSEFNRSCRMHDIIQIEYK